MPGPWFLTVLSPTWLFFIFTTIPGESGFTVHLFQMMKPKLFAVGKAEI
jgi:hypothetical protein